MNRDKQENNTSVLIRSIGFIIGILILFAIVVKKISVALPDIKVVGWALLFVSFFYCIACTIYLSKYIAKILKAGENKAQWVGAVLSVSSVLLFGYLLWDHIREYFQ